MRVLITGGGTGGHCTPAMAVAEALRSIDPSLELRYVGRSGGPESVLVPRAGLAFSGLSLGSMGSSPLTATPRLLTRLPLAYRQAGREVSGFRPQVVLGTGGYVCVPVVLAARRRRLPVVLLEQNRLPGRAINRLAPLASKIAVSFADTAEHLPPGRSVFTGNPVRAAFQRPSLELPARPAVLVMGGSQGARHLNQALVAALPDLLRRLPELEVTHLTGQREEARVAAEARALGLDRDPRYRPLPFSDQVAELAGSSRLVVMRAGGSSLAEMACLGRPLVLVPYPHAGNHQLANAEAFATAGAALLLEDSELSPKRLAQSMLTVLTEEGRAEQMARASLDLARPGAALEVARLILSTAAGA